MLARLEAIDGVRSAEADHRGEFLRLRVLGPEVITAVVAALREIGYEATVDATPDDDDARWYGAATVSELSREEAGIIAGRVGAAFGIGRDNERADIGALRRAVADALYGVFATHELGARSQSDVFRANCVRAVEAAAAPIVGSDGAREIASILESELG